MKSLNIPSIRPSDPTFQVVCISTLRITTATKKYTAQSLDEQFRNKLKSNKVYVYVSMYSYVCVYSRTDGGCVGQSRTSWAWEQSRTGNRWRARQESAIKRVEKQDEDTLGHTHKKQEQPSE